MHVQSSKLVHVSGIRCHIYASSASGCAFVYFTVLYRVQYLYFKPRMSGSKHKGISDVTGTVQYFSRCCAVKFKMFSSFFVFVFMYYLYEKDYQPITVPYQIIDCVSWVSKVTLLDLQTSWAQMGTCSNVKGLLQALHGQFSPRRDCKWLQGSSLLPSSQQASLEDSLMFATYRHISKALIKGPHLLCFQSLSDC